MLFAGGFGVFPRSPSMRREWIEILRIPDKRNKFPRLPPCGGSGLKYFHVEICEAKDTSPSMRREWIEMYNPAETPAHAYRLPPCGGSGLKCLGTSRQRLIPGSLPPCGGSGLKYAVMPWADIPQFRLPPCGGSGLK